MKKLTEEMRVKLKPPMGVVLSPEEAVAKAKEMKGRIICVGDSCAYAFLIRGANPTVIIYDLKTKRERVDVMVQKRLDGITYAPRLRIKNPAGFITDGLVDGVKEILRTGSGIIFIDGEEDLATLVVLVFGKDGDLVFYGQPDEGVVCVELNGKIRKMAKKFYMGMEEVSEFVL